MTANEEQFDLTPQIDEPLNSFLVIHIHNKSTHYHLTRQVLLDSTITQNTYCFFYHILAKNVNDFNEMYGSFACIIPNAEIEADLYLNVNSDALEHIIQYIQIGKINDNVNQNTIKEIIDLATMFGMPLLVSQMRSFLPSEDQINSRFDLFRNGICLFVELLLQNLKINKETKKSLLEKSQTIINDYLQEHKQEVTELVFNSYVSKNEALLNFFLVILTNIMISVRFAPDNTESLEKMDESFEEEHPSFNQLNSINNLDLEKLKEVYQQYASIDTSLLKLLKRC